MRNKILFTSLTLSAVVFFGCSQKVIAPMSAISATSILDKKVDSVLKLMTLEEKVGQLNQYNGFWEITGPTPKEGQIGRAHV